MLYLKCKGQVMSIDKDERIADQYINANTVHFEFCERWAEMEITAQFTQEGRTYNRLVDDITGTVTLPNEIVAGDVFISAFGVHPETGVRITSVAVKKTVDKSGFVGDGETPIPPTPDLYAQLLAEINDMGASEEDIKNAVNAYLDENPVQSGATTEQAAQIEANRQAIEELQNGGGTADSVAWDDVTGKPTTMPNPHALTINGQSYDGSEAVEVNITAGGAAESVAWGNVTGKPEEFPPAEHTHSYTELTDKPTIPTVPKYLPNPYSLTINGNTYNGSEAVNITISTDGGEADSVKWDNVTGKPSAYPPASHSHVEYVTEEQVNTAIDGSRYSLKGKKISIIGDSISTYNGYIPSGYKTWYPSGDVDAVEKTWWHQLITNTQMLLCTNASWSGSTLCGSSTSSSGSVGCSDARVNAAGGNGTPDIIVVCIGINDFANENGYMCGSYDGSSAVTTATAVQNITDAYGLLLNKLRTTYPNAMILGCRLMPEKHASYNDSHKNGFPNINPDDSVSLPALNENIEKICKAYGCGVIPMDASGVSFHNVPLWTEDGLHPNAAQMSRMAAIAEKYIRLYAGDISGGASETTNYFRVTYNLSNAVSSNVAPLVAEGSQYSAVITAKAGYELSSVTAIMGGEEIAVVNGVIQIEQVTGDIVITVSTIKVADVYYTVTNNLTNATTNNTATSVLENTSYTATITANDGYTLESVTVTMDGENVSVTGGVIQIAQVTGDIVITATATENAVIGWADLTYTATSGYYDANGNLQSSNIALSTGKVDVGDIKRIRFSVTEEGSHFINFFGTDGKQIAYENAEDIGTYIYDIPDGCATFAIAFYEAETNTINIQINTTPAVWRSLAYTEASGYYDAYGNLNSGSGTYNTGKVSAGNITRIRFTFASSSTHYINFFGDNGAQIESEKISAAGTYTRILPDDTSAFAVSYHEQDKSVINIRYCED